MKVKNTYKLDRKVWDKMTFIEQEKYNEFITAFFSIEPEEGWTHNLFLFFVKILGKCETYESLDSDMMKRDIAKILFK